MNSNLALFFYIFFILYYSYLSYVIFKLYNNSCNCKKLKKVNSGLLFKVISVTTLFLLAFNIYGLLFKVSIKYKQSYIYVVIFLTISLHYFLNHMKNIKCPCSIYERDLLNNFKNIKAIVLLVYIYIVFFTKH